MPGVYSFLRCLGEAVVAKGWRALANLVPYGELVYDVAIDTWERWRNLPDGNVSSLRLELQTTAQTELSHPEEFSQQIQQIVAVVASDQPAEVKERLTTYLTMVPARIRVTFSRPEDRRGLSVPGNWQPREARDLLPFIPPHLPRFKAGDRPPGAEKWQLVERLGLGGFGEVWKARHTLLNDRYSAFKFCLDAEAKQRLSQHEARIINQVMSQVDLPGVVKLLEVEYHAETPWLQYDYVAGGDLSAMALPVDVAQRVSLANEVILELAQTVAVCHRLRPPVVHRDLKPANILVATNHLGQRVCKITDFGIGDIVVSQALEAAQREPRNSVSFYTPTMIRSAHTPIYASPQQQEGKLPSPTDDVHALGVMWFQMLMGDFNLPKSHELREDLQDLGLSDGLIEAVLKSVASKIERRFKDAGELVDQIQQLPTHLMKPTGAVSALKASAPQPKPIAPPPIVAPALKAGSKYTSRVLGIEIVLVPKGAFWMGGGGGQAGDQRVEIAEDFYIGIYPVTQRQWQAVMGNNPSCFKGDELPVEQVSWDDVQEFLKKLNERERESGYLCRLPSEEEWEYACRGGPSSGNEMTKEECSFHFYFDNGPTNSLSSTQANFDGNYPYGGAAKGPYLEETTKVGSYRPNRLGLYDMHGNVWEWTSSQEGSGRVRRGGCWSSFGNFCLASFRYEIDPSIRNYNLGFRLARSPFRSK